MSSIESIPRGGPATALGAALALFFFAPTVQAQLNGIPASEVGSPTVSLPMAVAEPGVRVGEVRIDGLIDEAAWLAAPLITDFVQSEPAEAVPSEFRTEVRILFDNEAIYVSARLFDDPATIQRQLVRRDERGPFMDWFGFSLDPGKTQRTGYQFRINAAGVQQDLYVFDDASEDGAWNAVWESKVTVDSLGWNVEARVPLSQIRYDSGEGPHIWGVNFHRRKVATGELSHFSLESRRRNGLVSQYGTLHNVVVPSSVRRIEARPYVLSSLHNGPAEPGDPFFDGSATTARVGSDFRLGIGSAFTVDATVNPDFGQVEADPATINLSAFESFFDERRPFFVEDAQVFDFRLSGGQNQLFYSRRIGRAPRGDAPDDADFAEIPEASTILGAAKVTGRTSSGLSMGGLAAVTQAENGRAFIDGGMQDFRVEPQTEYGVVSVKQDLNGGLSQVGGIFTALHRSLPSDGRFDFLVDKAFNAGVRMEHQWDERRWRLTSFLAGSHVRGSPEALVAIQRASNHYFQRPDGTRARVDSTATSMSGAEWRVQLDRQNTEHWTGGIWLGEVTKGFEINDFGFSGSRERLDGGVRFGYREITPGRIFRDYNFNFNTFQNLSHEVFDDIASWREAHTAANFSLGSRFTFLNYHGGDVNVSWRPDLYSRAATRGGPVMIQPGNVDFRAGFNSDRRRSTSFSAGVSHSRGSLESGNELSVDGSIGLRPSSNLQVEVDARFGVQSDAGQYVTSTDTMPYAPTFGRRYFFGDLERKSLSLEGRVNYTFSPTLTFQLYVQPLLSSGDFVRYKQLEAAGTYAFRTFQEGQVVDLGGTVSCSGGSICRDAQGTQHVDLNGDGTTDYTFEDGDFNVRSLLGNAVLRWEYRPGSTVFLVWQRQQEREESVGNFDLGRDLDALWGAPADNRFIIKVNYWLGL